MDVEEMPRIAAPYTTISDKVRALHASGYPRSQIARFLGRHTTQVRNIIKADENRGRSFTPLQSETQCGVETARRAAKPSSEGDVRVKEAAPGVFHLHLGEGGDVVLPPSVVESFGFKPGQVVVAVREGESLVIRSRAETLRRVQARMRELVPEGVSMVDELIAERREAAARGD